MRALFLWALFIGVFLVAFSYAGRNIPIKIWDEAIYANNALEMRQSGNLLVLQNNGAPSLYNTKPPLAIWLEALSVAIFGINEFAIRLPSLVSVFGICLILVAFLRRHQRSEIPGVFAVLTLLTSRGFMANHVAATGDLDAVFSLWSTAFALTVLDILLTEGSQPINKKIWLAALFFCLGFLTKSTAIFLLLPGTFLAIIFSLRRNLILKNRQAYFAAFTSTLLILGYYFLMNALVPGYLRKVWFSEVQRLYKNIMPWHEQPWNFYWLNFAERFASWRYLLGFLSVLGLFSPIEKTRRFFRISICFCLCYLVMISIPTVKLIWYDAPLYPLFSLMVGYGFADFYGLLKERLVKRGAPVVVILFLLFYVFNYYKLLKDRASFGLEPEEKEGYFIDHIPTSLMPLKSSVIMTADHPEHYDQLNFYRKKLKSESKKTIVLSDNISSLTKDDTLFVCQQAMKDSILHQFIADTILQKDECLMIRIVDFRPMEKTKNRNSNRSEAASKS